MSPDKNTGPRSLPASQRRIISGFTKGDVGRSGFEYCIAVLLREGMDLRVLCQFEGLTRNRIRETVESVMQRVELRMDKPETPPKAGEIKRRYRNSLRSKTEGEKPLSYLNEELDAVAGEPQDHLCGSMVDWDALDIHDAAYEAESN